MTAGTHFVVDAKKIRKKVLTGKSSFPIAHFP